MALRRLALGLALRSFPDRSLGRWIAGAPGLRVDPSPAWTLRLTTAEVGAMGEELASRHLRSQGARLIGRNVRAPEAELDLVAIRGQTLTVVEVKAGWWPTDASPTEHRRPAARVTATGLTRRLRAARRIASELGRRSHQVDVIEVVSGRGRRAEIRHHQNVTSATLGRWAGP